MEGVSGGTVYPGGEGDNMSKGTGFPWGSGSSDEGGGVWGNSVPWGRGGGGGVWGGTVYPGGEEGIT